MSGMSLLAGKALSSARMSDILSQTSLTGSQQLQQREESGQQRGGSILRLSQGNSFSSQYPWMLRLSHSMWCWRGASCSSLLPFLLHQWYASRLQAPWPAVQHGAGWSLAQVGPTHSYTSHKSLLLHNTPQPACDPSRFCLAFPVLSGLSRKSQRLFALFFLTGWGVGEGGGGRCSLCTVVHISHPELSWVEQHHAKPPSCLSRVHSVHPSTPVPARAVCGGGGGLFRRGVNF